MDNAAWDTPLWQFAVAAYEREGVAELCLLLQDEEGVDVGFAFACLWLARRGCDPHLARDAIVRSFLQGRALHEQVLSAVRTARRRLKSLLVGVTPALQVPLGCVRTRLAESELELEKVQYALIHAELARVAEGPPLPPWSLFVHYLAAAGVPQTPPVHQRFVAFCAGATAPAG